VADFAKNKDKTRFISLQDIYALQLLSEYVDSCDRYFSNNNTGPYTSYEINLVLKSGDRVNVVDHGDGFQILADAQKLSQFLKVPVWNGISHKENASDNA